MNGVAENFGRSLAAVGNDRVLIGKLGFDTRGNVGAYLLSTNGTLLTTFSNPGPLVGVTFGPRVAAVGSDRVLIVATDYNLGNAVAVYLFSTNGTLMTTFTNPHPVVGGNFGAVVAAVGSSRVLIVDTDFNLGNTVAVYLFSTNGAMLNTFTNPSPAASDSFGSSVAAVGSDRVLIGAIGDNTGATGSGAAYLFDLPYPPLSIARDAATVSVKWVTPETGLALQQASVLGTSTIWSNTSNSVSISGLTNVVQHTMDSTNRFFRLHRLELFRPCLPTPESGLLLHRHDELVHDVIFALGRVLTQ